jgi:hypothetical protein
MVGMDPVIREHLGPGHPLARHVEDFLTDLANTNASGTPCAPTAGICCSSVPTTTATSMR